MHSATILVACRMSTQRDKYEAIYMKLFPVISVKVSFEFWTSIILSNMRKIVRYSTVYFDVNLKNLISCPH